MPSEKPRIVLYLEDTDKKSRLEAPAAAQEHPVSNYLLTLIKRELAQAEADGTLPALRETHA